MSKQLAIVAFASTLSLAALALSSQGLSNSGYTGESLLPSVAQLPETHLPALPAILPR